MSIRVFCVCCLTMLIVVGCQPTVTSYGPPVLETQARTEEVAETQIVPPSEINPAIEHESSSAAFRAVRRHCLGNGRWGG